jgi:dTDP-4-dehydrorhamnose 3,5-epimerase
MRLLPTKLPGVVILEPTVYEDPRGFFMESYSQRDLAAQGIADVFVQDNHSRSVRNVLRGLHYQVAPAQSKLLRVVVGKVLDVAVDIRWGAPTFGQWVGVHLSAENRRQLYVPEGFAHGFCVLSDVAEVIYKVNSYYQREGDRGIAWDDPDIGVAWPIAEPLLSARDQAHPRLCDAPQDFLYQYPLQG